MDFKPIYQYEEGGEIWVPIVGYEGKYEISDQGRVKAIAKFVNIRDRAGKLYMIERGEKIKKLSYNKRNPYAYVTLIKEGSPRTFTIHRLMMPSFIGPRPEGMVICHGDGCGYNNCLDNLRYDTRSANEGDKLIHGTRARGSKVGTAVLTEEQVIEIVRLCNNGEKRSDVAKEFNTDYSNVCLIMKGKYWSWLTGITLKSKESEQEGGFGL